MGRSNQAYTQVNLEEELFLEKDKPELKKQWLEPKPARPKTSTILLSLTTIIFGLHSLYLSLNTEVSCKIKHPSSYSFETEWEPARKMIEMQQVIYTSAFRYNESSKDYYRESDPSKPQYVGKPSPEIDSAWENLLAGQYIMLSDKEAEDLDEPVKVQGYYIAEVEVMHSLHCLNAIRMALHHEYYSIHDKHKLPKALQNVHIEHCIDQLRQSIQCAGDLTPVPLRPFGEVPDINLIGTPQVHTCRNWDTFRTWYTKRGDTYGKVSGGGI